MTHKRLQLGAWGEEQAALYLLKNGYRILERNLRTPVGEIDLICQKRKLLVFVEVKTRRSHDFGWPQEAVGRNKKRHLIRTAQWYLAQHNCRGMDMQFDVISIITIGGQIEIEHLRNVLEVE